MYQLSGSYHLKLKGCGLIKSWQNTHYEENLLIPGPIYPAIGIIKQQIFTLDAVVFHQLCTIYQHLWGDIIYHLTLEKTSTVHIRQKHNSHFMFHN